MTSHAAPGLRLGELVLNFATLVVGSSPSAARSCGDAAFTVITVCIASLR
jgi:hypothetical protein